MRAVRFHEHGPASVLVLESVPDPAPGPGEVQVEVRASAVNHLDIFVRRGIPGARLRLPHIPGADGAGIVRALGDGADEGLRDQRVVIHPGVSCGVCEFCDRGLGGMCPKYRIFGEHTPGTYAESIVVPARNVLPIPDRLSFEEAAAVPLVFLTAWSMLVTRGRVRAGEDVLILGAGAGVGTAAIQIARLSGCRVWAAAGSEAKLRRAAELGAEELINTNEARFDDVVRERTKKRGVDVVVDYIGADTWVQSLRAVRRGGRILTCGATSGHAPRTDLRHIFFRQLQVIGSTMGNMNDFREVMALVFRGSLEPVVGAILPLADARKAHEMLETRQAIGKIVLVP